MLGASVSPRHTRSRKADATGTTSPWPRGTETAEDRIQGWRLAAQEIEDCVISILVDALTSPGRLLDRLDIPDIPSDQMRRLLGRAARLAATLRNSLGERAKVIRELVERVIVDEKRIVVAATAEDFSRLAGFDSLVPRKIDKARQSRTALLAPTLASMIR